MAIIAEVDGLDQYVAEIAHLVHLSAGEEAALAKRIKQGDVEARNELAQSLLLYVFGVAKSYQGRGLALADLVGAGNLGLLTAAERFDERKGYKFISYATWWIRQAILQALADHRRTVRVPVNKQTLLKDIKKIEEMLGYKSGNSRPPTPEEIAAELGSTIEQVKEALVAGQAIASLDTTVAEDGSDILNSLPDVRQPSADAVWEAKELSNCVTIALQACLEGRELATVIKYFGLDGNPPMSLNQIGVYYGVSRKTVRKDKLAAFAKLRSPENARIWSMLKEFFQP